jgi:hypothetical protein
MVENPIDHHLDPAVVRFSDQLEEQLVRSRPLPSRRIIRFPAVADDLQVTFRVGAKIRINMVERVTIVFVLRTPVKNRIELDRRDPQILQIVELVDHTLQVTAVTPVEDAVLVKAVPDRLFPLVTDEVIGCPRGDPPSTHIREMHFQSLARGVVGGITIAETLGEDLIPYSRLAPIGDIIQRGLCLLHPGQKNKNKQR